MKKEIHVFSQEDVDSLCKSIKASAYIDITSVEFDETMTYVSVCEEDCGCSVYAGSREDSARYGLPSGKVIHSVLVGNYTLLITEDENGFKGVRVPKGAGYGFPPKDKVLRRQLTNCLKSKLSSSNFDCLGVDLDSQFAKDWSHDGLVWKILRELQCKEFVKLNGTIYPVRDSVESLLAKLKEDGKDVTGYTKLGRYEVAEELSGNVQMMYD